ncbi:MAG: nucleotidyltransferase family protein [Bacteroidales bacterium]|nr:nucleotidyltransferase family protein [Bacteroidales bacterium]
MNPFFELIQIALGVRDNLESVPQNREQWDDLLSTCSKHNLVAVTFPVIDSLHDKIEVPLGVYSRWAMMSEKVQQKNERLKAACKYLSELFAAGGFRSCILKGLGVASLYPDPSLRQSGDIDIWVEGDRDVVLAFLKDKCTVTDIVYHHCHTHIIKGVSVEVHFTPTWMNSPCYNRKLQKYFSSNADSQFGNYVGELGFSITTLRMSAVYLLIHIYRHVLDEGIGFRQLLDYYYVLNVLDSQTRKNVIKDLKSLGMMRFAAGVMYILREVFAIDPDLMLCKPDYRQGKFLLEEILVSGNFGKFDSRNAHSMDESRLMHGKRKLRRALRFLAYYPSEVLSLPLFLVWHYFWRLRKGYIK